MRLVTGPQAARVRATSQSGPRGRGQLEPGFDVAAAGIELRRLRVEQEERIGLSYRTRLPRELQVPLRLRQKLRAIDRRAGAGRRGPVGLHPDVLGDRDVVLAIAPAGSGGPGVRGVISAG